MRGRRRGRTRGSARYWLASLGLAALIAGTIWLGWFSPWARVPSSIKAVHTIVP